MRSGELAHPAKNRPKVRTAEIKQYGDFIQGLYHKGNQMELTPIFYCYKNLPNGKFGHRKLILMQVFYEAL